VLWILEIIAEYPEVCHNTSRYVDVLSVLCYSAVN